MAQQARAIADDDPRVQEIVRNLRESIPDITVADDYLVKSAKLELALVDFFTRNRLTAMSMFCWTLRPQYGVAACALFGRMTQRGMLTACETDTLGALAMVASYQAALGETLPHFVDWTIRHREDPNMLLAWHCGNAPIGLANDPKQVHLRSRRDPTGKLPIQENDMFAGLLYFQLMPGKVTLCRLAEHRDKWKMLIAPGEIIPSDDLNRGNWSWVRVNDQTRLYRTLVEEGFIHHASLIHGDQTRALVEACKFLDIQPIVVN